MLRLTDSGCTRCPLMDLNVQVEDYVGLPSPRHIRILDLYKRPTRSLLQGALRVVDLDNRDNQSYVAISHTWGQGKLLAQLALQGSTIWIPQNLAKFLGRLRELCDF